MPRMRSAASAASPGVRGQLHAAGLAPPTDMDLRLHHHLAAEPPGNRLGHGRRRGDVTVQHGHASRLQQRARLIFMDVHDRSSETWENRPEGSPRPKAEQARAGTARGQRGVTGGHFEHGAQLLEGAPERGEVAAAEGRVGHPEPAAGVDQGAAGQGAWRQRYGGASKVGPGLVERAGGAHARAAGDAHPGHRGAATAARPIPGLRGAHGARR